MASSYSSLTSVDVAGIPVQLVSSTKRRLLLIPILQWEHTKRVSGMFLPYQCIRTCSCHLRQVHRTTAADIAAALVSSRLDYANTVLDGRPIGTSITRRDQKLSYRQRPARRSVSVEISAYCCTNNANGLARGALSATARFYSAACIVLYTHRCTRHNYHTASMQCRACYQQTSIQPLQSWWCQLDRNCDRPASTTTNVVDVTAYYSASVPSWKRTTVADGHNGFKQQKWPSRSLKGPFDRPHTIS